MGLLVFMYFIIIIFVNARRSSEDKISILLQILTNYLQLITATTSFNVQYPVSLIDVFLPIKSTGEPSEAFLSFDCFVTDYEIKGPFTSNVIFKLFLMFFVPSILIVLTSTIWSIIYLVKRKWVEDLKQFIVVSFICICFLMHPKITKESFSMFRCVEIDDGIKAVRIDTSIE